MFQADTLLLLNMIVLHGQSIKAGIITAS